MSFKGDCRRIAGNCEVSFLEFPDGAIVGAVKGGFPVSMLIKVSLTVPFFMQLFAPDKVVVAVGQPGCPVTLEGVVVQIISD